MDLNHCVNRSNLWDNLSFPDDLDWLDDPAGKDSCRRFQMTYSTAPKLWGTEDEKISEIEF